MSRKPIPVEIIGFPEPRTMQQSRADEANLITAGLAVVCGVACACGIFPAFDRVVSTFFVIALAPVVVVVLLRLIVGWLRRRREDREDAEEAARWRAAHAEVRSTADRHDRRIRAA